jgi:SAM-dependent methyltransferase
MPKKKAAPHEPVCQICGKKSRTKYLECGEYTYYRCKSCGGIFVFPVKPQEFYLGTETYLTNPLSYTSSINPHGQRWMVEQFERLYIQKMQSSTLGKKLLEIGAGVGYLTLFALARGWEAKGIETSKPAVQFGKDYLRVDLEHTTIEDYTSDEKFDAIAMVEVLEHFLDPVKAIRAMRRLSGAHTFLFGTTPNTDSEHWQKSDQNIYVPDDHIFLFNERSIQRFADKAGIRDLTVEYFGSGEKHDSNLMYAGVIPA